MNPSNVDIYLREILNQIEAAEIAVSDYNDILKELASGSQRAYVYIPRLYACVQSALTAAALISKLLWPSPPTLDAKGQPLSEEEEAKRQRSIDRGKTLRKSVGDTHSISVLQSRKVRNGLEHFDERLDQYLFEAGVGANIFDRNVGPLNMIRIDGKSPKYLRHIDPSSHTAMVLDDKTDLQQIMTALQILKVRASALTNRRGEPQRGA